MVVKTLSCSAVDCPVAPLNGSSSAWIALLRAEQRAAEASWRVEQRAAEARLRAEQKAEREARRRAKEQTEREAQRRAEQRNVSVAESFGRGDGSASTGRSRYVPPLELEPCSDDWLAWYAARRLRSRDDMLNDNDARRGIVPPLERRTRERARSVR